MSNNKKHGPKQQIPKPEAQSPDPPVGTLPDLGHPEEEASGSGLQAPGDPPEARSPKPEASSSTITIEIPIGALSETGYVTGHVEVNHLSTKQKQGLNRLWNGLRDDRATLQDRDREVATPADAVRLVLELIADAVGE